MTGILEMLKQGSSYTSGLIRWVLLIGWLALALMLTGCKPGGPAPTIRDPEPSPTVSAALAAPTISPTPMPTEVSLAARVNSYPITLAEYQSELAMFQADKGTELAAEDKTSVLNDLIDQALLAGAAEKNGFVVDEATLEERIQQLIMQLGSEQALTSWLSTYQFDQQTFRLSLRRSIAAAWMRDQIAASVPETAEQVHARQVLLYNQEQAAEIYQQLQSGNSFQNLALKYDPLTGGDLGWFPRGYLPAVEIEHAAFNLQPEEYSQIIESPAGFHIIQVLERDPQRPLSPDARLVLQNQALIDWITQARAESQIEILADAP